jgi:hypothetical protein
MSDNSEGAAAADFDRKMSFRLGQWCGVVGHGR